MCSSWSGGPLGGGDPEQGLQGVGSELCIFDMGHPRLGTASWYGA